MYVPGRRTRPIESLTPTAHEKNTTSHRTTLTDEGVTSQLTDLFDNARSLFTHELPLPKDWAIWTSSASATTAETEGGEDDTASTDNWWFSSPVNRPPPNNGNNGNAPPNGRPPRPNRPNNGNNGSNGNGGSGRPEEALRALKALPSGEDDTARALQWENEQDGGYDYPQPTAPPTDTYGYLQPTASPIDTYGSFPYGGEPEAPEYGEPVYEDPEHDKMAAVPGAKTSYRAKSHVVRALENMQFNKARAGHQPFNLRGSTKA